MPYTERQKRNELRSQPAPEAAKHRKASTRKKRRPRFGIEARWAWLEPIQKTQAWLHWRWYDTEAARDKALEGLRNKTRGHVLRATQYRAKERD